MSIAVPVQGASPKHMVAVGAICNTIIFRVEEVPPLPAKALASEICPLIDGMAASAAYAFVKLGGSAEIWARVGDDAHGIEMRRALSADGLETHNLRTIPGTKSSQANVVVDKAGDRLVVAYHDPNIDRSASWLPLDDLSKAGLLHCDVRWVEGAEAALIAARNLGIPSMIDGDVAPIETLHRLVPLARYAIFSDIGLLAYADCKDVEQALLKVGSTHDGHVGASCGSLGYFWYDNGEIRHITAPKVEVVDTLAAGDVFHGAFALGLLEGKSIEECARFACIAASLKCTQFGGRLACPTRAEVDLMLAEGY